MKCAAVRCKKPIKTAPLKSEVNLGFWGALNISEKGERMAKVIKSKGLILKPTLDDIDRTEAVLSQIIAADEFELYFGFEASEMNKKQFTLMKEGFYNIFDSKGTFLGYIGVHREEPDYEVEIYIFSKNSFTGKTLNKEARQ